MVDSQCICIISSQCQSYHAAKFAWKCISDDRYDTNSSQGNQREGNTIISRNNVKIGRFIFDDIIHLGDVTGSFLDSNNIFEVTGNAQRGFCFHIYTGTTGNIIEYNWELCSLCNCFIMLINTFLRRFIIIGNNRQNGIYSGKIVVLKRIHNGTRIISTNTEQDRYPTIYAFDDHFLDFLFFFFRQCRSFCCGAQHTQKISIVLKLIVHQTYQCIVINAFILFKRSNQRYPHSFQFSLYHE